MGIAGPLGATPLVSKFITIVIMRRLAYFFSQAQALQKPWPTLRELAGREIRLRIELSVLGGRIRAQGRVPGVI